MADVQHDRDRWLYRRRALFGSLIFLGAAIGYLLIWGEDDALRRELGGTMVLAFAGLVVSYIGGAVADDWLQRKGGADVRDS